MTYHTDSNDAITGANAIANTTNFTNTSDPQPIFARITNDLTGCFNYIEFSISINPGFEVPNSEVAICDDASDGDDLNGQATFDFNAVTSELFNGEDISDLTYNYYLSQADADVPASPLPMTYHTADRNVFIRVANTAACFTIKEIHLIVNPLPLRKTVSLVQCDTEANPDGLTLFNLSQATTGLLGGDRIYR
ncbi:hypothetical protein [Flavobacterium sp. 3HN19-14]|uniref:hypothetical protein n=1 Tax=Flavobacterium sp. 3HN19-14 TaxID=3448133 RepID=UPI003EE3749F